MTRAAIDIDWASLGRAAYVSVIAGLAILLIAGAGVASSLKAARSRAGEDGGSAVGLYGALALACLVALAAIVAYGIFLLQK